MQCGSIGCIGSQGSETVWGSIGCIGSQGSETVWGSRGRIGSQGSETVWGSIGFIGSRHGTLLTQVRLPGAALDFSPTVSFHQCRLSHLF